MILITLGTTKFTTKRYDHLVSQLLLTFPKEQFIYQSPTSKLKSVHNLKIYKELDPEELTKFMRKARVIITHGGPATIFQALFYSHHLPIIIPRTAEFREHVNDHQIFFARYLENHKKITVIYPGDSYQKIENDIRLQKKNSIYNRSSADNLINKLHSYIKSSQ